MKSEIVRNMRCGGVCRKFVAEARFIQIVGAIQLLLAAWALLSSVSAGTQPLVACELHECNAGVANCLLAQDGLTVSGQSCSNFSQL